MRCLCPAASDAVPALVPQVNRQQPIFGLHSGREGVVAVGKGGRLLYWPGSRTAPLLLSDVRSVNLSHRMGEAASPGGSASIFLRGDAACVRAISVRGERIAMTTRGGEVWDQLEGERRGIKWRGGGEGSNGESPGGPKLGIGFGGGYRLSPA